MSVAEKKIDLEEHMKTLQKAANGSDWNDIFKPFFEEKIDELKDISCEYMVEKYGMEQSVVTRRLAIAIIKELVESVELARKTDFKEATESFE